MKKLEDEYRELMTEQVPDLWDRIEAGLCEKGEMGATEAETPVMDPAPARKKDKIVKFSPKKWVPVAAAVALLLICIPAYMNMNSRRFSKTAEFNGMAAQSGATANDAAFFMEECEEEADGGMQESLPLTMTNSTAGEADASGKTNTGEESVLENAEAAGAGTIEEERASLEDASAMEPSDLQESILVLTLTDITLQESNSERIWVCNFTDADGKEIAAVMYPDEVFGKDAGEVPETGREYKVTLLRNGAGESVVQSME